jgi:hypothetical protein
MDSLPLVCVDCGRIFQDKTVTETTKEGTTSTRVISAHLQAYLHTSGEEAQARQKGAPTPGQSCIPKKHHVFHVSKAAWEAGYYNGWPEARYVR